MDEILIASELVDEVKHRRKDFLLFKVDFEITYDLVKLDYLCMIMSKINFPDMWRTWIMECLSMTSSYVLVNESRIDEFQLSRSIWQGYPISPFLLLIVIEGLNVLVNASVDADLFKDFKLVKRMPLGCFIFISKMTH